MKILCTKEEFRRMVATCESDDNRCLETYTCCMSRLCDYCTCKGDSKRGDWLSSVCEIVPEEVSGND